MSSINGDKSRQSVNRKRTVVRRAKIRQMMADRKTANAAKTGATPPKPTK
jgi:hypothetical protein